MAPRGLDAIHAMNAKISDIEDEIGQASAEADMLRHIDDDAQRDALVSDNAEDRQIARMTKKDVRRAEKYVDRLVRQRETLVRKRTRAIDRIARS